MDAYDQKIQAAIRRRILRELSKDAAAQSVVNNVYGGGGGKDPREGLEHLLAPDALDYMVDITRKSDPTDPKGWSKQVHRYAAKKA